MFRLPLPLASVRKTAAIGLLGWSCCGFAYIHGVSRLREARGASVIARSVTGRPMLAPVTSRDQSWAIIIGWRDARLINGSVCWSWPMVTPSWDDC
jgi:hypothetical protein